MSESFRHQLDRCASWLAGPSKISREQLRLGHSQSYQAHHALIAIRMGRPSPCGRQTVAWRLPDRPLRSSSSLWPEAFLQRLIDKRLDLRISQTRVVLSKLVLEGWTGGSHVLFTSVPVPLTGLLIYCLAFRGPRPTRLIGRLLGSRCGIN